MFACHLRGDGEVALLLEVYHRSRHTVCVAMLLAEVLHKARAEVATQDCRYNLHANEVGMVAREEQATDADRGLQRLLALGM